MTEDEWRRVLATAAHGDDPLPDWIEEPPAELGEFSSEQEWLACEDPRIFLLFTRRKASQRKLRLFAVACCREIWDSLPGKDCQEKVELAELYAEGNQPRDGLDRPFDGDYGIGKRRSDEQWRAGYAAFACWHAARPDAWDAATHALEDSINTRYYPARPDDREAWAKLVRDIFGNPFRSVAFDPIWRTDTVVSLAWLMYESREFSPMPILADALQDAGCDNTDILSHCRVPGPHVRGCWVVDLILGKE